MWESISRDNQTALEPWSGRNLVGVNGSPLTTHGRARVQAMLEGEKVTLNAIVVSNLTLDAILGLEFLRENNAIINVKQKQLTIGDNARILTLHYVEGGGGAYQCVRETIGHKLDQQKDYYDKRVHGKPYSKGDLVWLHSCVVLKGVANKLHRLGPAPSVSRRKSQCTYRIQDVQTPRRHFVVHFDRLKLCPTGIRLPTNSKGNTQQSSQSNQQPVSVNPSSSHPGTTLQIVDNDDCTTPSVPRYPRREQTQPQYLHPMVSHQ